MRREDPFAEAELELAVVGQAAPCGAIVTGVDLSQALRPEQVAAIRAAWLNHQVLGFPDQLMAAEQIERFARYLGPFGDDPYIESIPGHPHVVQVRREADEKTPLFAESWHSDWSFLPSPPAGTVLYGNVIPPIGGDTLFANQYLAWDGLADAVKRLLSGRRGIHSARRGYARDGLYGERDAGRSMAIRYGDSALHIRTHPIARRHPETGRTALFASPAYTIGIEDLPEAESNDLLRELFAHQTKPEYVYRHKWSEGMLTLWDNRCLLHAATGGYEGHRRLLHRVTIAERHF
jgi:taurine dioxygenase